MFFKRKPKKKPLASTPLKAKRPDDDFYEDLAEAAISICEAVQQIERNNESISRIYHGDGGGFSGGGSSDSWSDSSDSGGCNGSD